MRDKLGLLLQLAGLVAMPFALWEGMRDDGSLGNELLIAFVAFLLIVIGRGLRGGGRAK